MSEATRHPTGYGENLAVLAIAGSIGKYLASLVGDPNLSELIIGGTMMGGKLFQTWLANHHGAPLAHVLPGVENAMKGAKLGVILMAAYLPLGCATFGPNECKNYTSLAKILALQIAELADPATPEGQELRDRWAAVGELAAKAGCEHLDEPEPEVTL